MLRMYIPNKGNAPVSVTDPERLLLTMQQLRNENKQLKADVEKIKEELLKSSLPVQKDLDGGQKIQPLKRTSLIMHEFPDCFVYECCYGVGPQSCYGKQA